ncbi:MAG: tRNA preQ1(34) S-adenosylmethionine ribosyltransferase-isomerase QueA [Rhodospirillaceae bacterium]|jgi:S-adenosylmethionine:tRNA ribosyltransferase-isomerase|nr:tRNA preQ1(34) S-adenosylmethionine ribosyltransferase-isomerase QueA [Rhodospirillaceae bacterium]
MRVDLFDFKLPNEVIAKRPARPRDVARLLNVTSENLIDYVVSDLPTLLMPGDLMVFNDTMVIPARLKGKRDTLNISVTLHKSIGNNCWWAFAKQSKKLIIGDRVQFTKDFSAEIIEKSNYGEILLLFDRDDVALNDALKNYGEIPLPPYIKRPHGADEHDRIDYQTIYALSPGAIASPTAGLHFTENLLTALDQRGVHRETLTLHVGAGTFLPVRVDDTNYHKMHPERGYISAAVAGRINLARDNGHRIIAVGTTTLRLLESATKEDGRLCPFDGTTNIFITPGYRFRIVNLLMTNFHLPRSTLFMLVSAFAGLDRMKLAYNHAIKNNYRFYSYGDTSLLHCQEIIR